MTELIIAVFDRAQTGHLARAALGRMQSDLALRDEDLVVVTRDKVGRVILCEPHGVRDAGAQEMHETFWNTLVRLLTPRTSARADRKAASAKLAAIGIDATCDRCFDEHFQAGSSALFVLIDGPTMREQVVGVLDGFGGKVMRKALNGDDRKNWLRVMSGA